MADTGGVGEQEGGAGSQGDDQIVLERGFALAREQPRGTLAPGLELDYGSHVARQSLCQPPGSGPGCADTFRRELLNLKGRPFDIGSGEDAQVE